MKKKIREKDKHMTSKKKEKDRLQKGCRSNYKESVYRNRR